MNMVNSADEDELIANKVTELLFEFIKISKTWYENDECLKAQNRILILAEKLDVLQYSINIAMATSGGIGISSGILGTIGFGLLFGGPTAFFGAVLLAISSGSGALGTLTEIIAKLHKYLKKKKYRKIAISEMISHGNISYKQLLELGEKFESVTELVAKNLSQKHQLSPNNHSWKEISVMCVLFFFHDLLESYEEICKQVYKESNMDLFSIKMNTGALRKYNKHVIRIKTICKEYINHINEIWNYVQPLTVGNSLFDLVDKAIGAASILKSVKLASDAEKTAEFLIRSGDVLSDIATAVADTGHDIDVIAETTLGIKNSAYVADSVSDTSAVVGTFAKLSKCGQVMASIGCFFNVLSIGLGSYTIHCAMKNMHDNKSPHHGASKEGKRLKQCACMIKIGLFIRNSKKKPVF